MSEKTFEQRMERAMAIWLTRNAWQVEKRDPAEITNVVLKVTPEHWLSEMTYGGAAEAVLEFSVPMRRSQTKPPKRETLTHTLVDQHGALAMGAFMGEVAEIMEEERQRVADQRDAEWAQSVEALRAEFGDERVRAVLDALREATS